MRGLILLNNLFSLKNKSVVLFGGRGYLGGYFTEALLKQGAVVHNVDIKDIDDSLNKKIIGLKEKYNEKLHFYKCDASQKKEINTVKKEILSNSNKVDVLINAITAKGNDFYKPFPKVSLEGWEIGLKGNLNATFLACQVFLPDMAERKSGSIINISSIYGIVGNDQRIYKDANLNECYIDENEETEEEKQIYSHPVYSAAKGGIISLTRYLAAYYGKDNIRVNTLTPGGVSYQEENDEFVKAYSKKTPLGRKADPKELNGALIYLASDASSYVTGHNLVVDGGWTCW